MRLMLDSTTPAVIPVDLADLVAGYVDGSYAWSAADWARFPGVPQVRICVTGDHTKGNCLDVEAGDATPDHAPGWIRAGPGPVVLPVGRHPGWSPAARRPACSGPVRWRVDGGHQRWTCPS